MSLLSAFIGSRIAVATVVTAVVAVGGISAAAATGVLPDAIAAVTTEALVEEPATETDTDTELVPEPTASPTAVEAEADEAKRFGPDATGSAAYGLCTAYTAGGLGEKSTARAALTTAAGSTDEVAAYCETVFEKKAERTASRGGGETTTDETTADEGDISDEADTDTSAGTGGSHGNAGGNSTSGKGGGKPAKPGKP